MQSPIISYYLDKKVEELENHFKRDRIDKDLFDCEKILLFHAAFYSSFPDSARNRINRLYEDIYFKDSNLGTVSFVYNFGSLIILQKLLRNESERSDEYIAEILNFTSHHFSGNRRVNSLFIAHLLDRYLDPEYELCEYPFKDHIIHHCYGNILSRHGGNSDLYSLITFLNISSENKKSIFDGLYIKAKENDHRWDYATLKLLKAGKCTVANPFFEDFLKTQQNILHEVSCLNVPVNHKSLLDQQLNTSNQVADETGKIDSYYMFDDYRLKRYLLI